MRKKLTPEQEAEIYALYVAASDLSVREIESRYNLSRSYVSVIARRNNWPKKRHHYNYRVKRFFPTKAQLEEIRHLYEETEQTTTEIALKYKTTKNTIIGIANRQCWLSLMSIKSGKYKQPTTTKDRLDALLDRFNVQTGA